MKISLSELIRKRRLTRFSSAVPLLTDVYVAAHSWNADDYISEVYKRKRDYVVYKLLILNIKNKKFDGNVRYKDVLDDHGYPFFDNETGEPAQELDLDESDVNLIELIQFMVNERKEIDIIPDELLIAAGIEPPKNSILTGPLFETVQQKELSVINGNNDTSIQPKAIENADIECNSSSAIDTSAESKHEQAPEPREDMSNQKYCFKKIGHSWNIIFGDEELPGLKHTIGMDYIKILLQSPYEEIGVFDIQAMMNPDNIPSSMEMRTKDRLIPFSDEDEVPLHSRFKEYPGTQDKDDKIAKAPNISDDSTKSDFDEHSGNLEMSGALKNLMNKLPRDKRDEVKMLYEQVEGFKVELEEARGHNDTIKASRLTSLKQIAEDDMFNILHSRSDDPELDKNRKKVYKNIEDARKNIQEAEISKGYKETPVYNYLKKHIETGYTCKYIPFDADHNHWIF